MNLHHDDRWCELVGEGQIGLREWVDTIDLVSVDITQGVLINGGCVSCTTNIE